MINENQIHQHDAALSRELYKARALLRRLCEWSAIMGGWDAQVWDDTRAFLARDLPEPPPLRPDELGD